MSLLGVDVADSVLRSRVARDLLVDGMRADSERLVALRAVHDEVIAEPEHAPLIFGDGARREAPSLYDSRGDARKWEIGVPAVVVDLDAMLSKQPRLAIRVDDAREIVRQSVG